MAVLIPSIDLMGGKIVQLVQGEKKRLEFDDFEYWIERFSQYPLVQLIDLDAAMGTGGNRELIVHDLQTASLPGRRWHSRRCIAARVNCWRWGRRVILGSALLTAMAQHQYTACAEAAAEFGAQQLTFAIDSTQGQGCNRDGGRVTAITPAEMMRAGPWCAAFLYTHIDTEGTMAGFPMDRARELAGLNKADDRRGRHSVPR